MWFGDSLCSQEGVGAGDEDGVADGDFAVGDTKEDPPFPSLKGRELFSPFKGEIEGVSENKEVRSPGRTFSNLERSLEVAEEQMNTKCYCNK